MNILNILKNHWLYVIGGLLIITLCVYLYVKFFTKKPIEPKNNELVTLKNTVKTLQNQLEHGVIVEDKSQTTYNQLDNPKQLELPKPQQNGRIEARIDTVSSYYAEDLPDSVSVSGEQEAVHEHNPIVIDYDERDCDVDSQIYNLNILNPTQNVQEVDEIKSIYEPEPFESVSASELSHDSDIDNKNKKIKIKLNLKSN